MKNLLKFDKSVFKIYIEKTALYYLFSVAFILLVEMLARHSPVKGWRFVWDHPFLILYSALILTTVYSLTFLFRRRRFVWLLITALFLTLGVSNCILLFYRITPLAATDISDNTKKRLFDRCAYYNIKIALLPVSAQELGNALGRGACAAVALSDASFIKALSKAAQTEL